MPINRQILLGHLVFFPFMNYQLYIYVGDFNSHHSLSKHQSNDEDGERLVNWADLVVCS